MSSGLVSVLSDCKSRTVSSCSRACWETRKAFWSFLWLGQRRMEPRVWGTGGAEQKEEKVIALPSVAHRKGKLGFPRVSETAGFQRSEQALGPGRASDLRGLEPQLSPGDLQMHAQTLGQVSAPKPITHSEGWGELRKPDGD